MRSKSYYATVVGSSFLLLIACTTQCAKPEHRADPALVAAEKQDEKQDEKKADEKKAETKGVHGYGSVITTGPMEDGGDETGGESHGDTPAMGDGGPRSTHKKTKDGCRPGAMRFEGKCLNKRKVQKILDKRDEEIKKKVQDATNAQQQADAAHDFLEQQIAQMDKTEDDLDEIIEQLKEENAKKLDGPPDKNADKL